VTKPPTGAAAAAIAAARDQQTIVPTGPSPDAVTVLGTPAIRAIKLKGDRGTFELPTGRHVVGRAEGVSVSILDPQMSRAHAVLLVTSAEVRVEDTKSANGTSVNGVKVVPGESSSVVLKTGDRLSFGKVEFTVELIS
jgi:pSer/pThr/pTyr-binding forkhead associated (FHA) protein